MAVRKLGTIYVRFVYRTDLIAERFRAPLPQNIRDSASCQPIHAAGEVQLINRLLVLWGEYCRNLVIASALGNAVTIKGTLLAPAPDVAEFSHIKAKLSGNSGAGPGTRWDDPEWALRQTNLLSPVNRDQIGLGLETAPVKDLKAVRNFLIHPNEHTAKNYRTLAQKLGYTSALPKVLLTGPVGIGSNVLESWIIDFQNSAYNAAL